MPFFQLDSYLSAPLWKPASIVAKPISNRPRSSDISFACSLGCLRLGVPGLGGRVQWLDGLPQSTTASFLPGHTDYEVASPDGQWKATIRVAPTIGMHGMVCEVRFDRDMAMVWQYGNVYFTEDAPQIKLTIRGAKARFTDALRPMPSSWPVGMVRAGAQDRGRHRNRIPLVG